jgi:general stress protein 26
MLMTIDDRAAVIGRPMLPLFLENDPCLYFLTHESSRKVRHITARSQVGLTMISRNCYFVVTGTAAMSHEQELIQRLWQPTYRAWFPEGKDDREVTVLRVTVDRVDYWEPPRRHPTAGPRPDRHPRARLDRATRRHHRGARRIVPSPISV